MEKWCGLCVMPWYRRKRIKVRFIFVTVIKASVSRMLMNLSGRKARMGRWSRNNLEEELRGLVVILGSIVGGGEGHLALLHPSN